MFFVEVTYFHKIEIYYKCLPLLLIPLILNACLFIIDEVSLAQIDYVTPHMTYESKGNRLVFQLAPVSPNIPNALSLEIMQKSLTWLTNQYQIFVMILIKLKSYIVLSVYFILHYCTLFIGYSFATLFTTNLSIYAF